MEQLEWCLATLRDRRQVLRHPKAVIAMQKEVQHSTRVAEQAKKMGAVQCLTRLLATTSDDELLDAISHTIAACSGVLACSGKERVFDYGSVSVCIKEGALGDGLGARVWAISHVLCRELVAYPEIVLGQRVLELGSGTGLLGICAAKLGARQVLLTDYEPQVLQNLRECVRRNSSAATTIAAHKPPYSSASAAGRAIITQQGLEQQLWQNEDSEDECVVDVNITIAASDDEKESKGLAYMLRAEDGSCSNSTRALPGTGSAWTVDNMHVRLMDWDESVTLLDGTCQQQQQQQHDNVGTNQPPGVPLTERFSVVLGCEVMYEQSHAQQVAAALAHRLAPGGRALLCCAVRRLDVFATFKSACAARGLRYRSLAVQPLEEDYEGGILTGREQDYEGGFLFIAVDHERVPCTTWHRGDFV